MRLDRDRSPRPSRAAGLALAARSACGPQHDARADAARHRRPDVPASTARGRAVAGRPAPRTGRRPLRLAVRAGRGEVDGTAWGPAPTGCSTGCPTCSAPTTTRAASSPRTPCCATPGAGTPGWRVPRTGRVLEALSRRAGAEDHRPRGLAAPGARWSGGTASPRPARSHRSGGLWSPPTAATWAHIPSWEWHRAGVDPSRSRTAVIAAASRRAAGGARRAAAGRGRHRGCAPLPGHRRLDRGRGRAARARRRRRRVGRRLPPRVAGRLGADRRARRRRRDARAARALPRPPLPRRPPDRAGRRRLERHGPRSTASTTARCTPVADYRAMSSVSARSR